MVVILANKFPNIKAELTLNFIKLFHIGDLLCNFNGLNGFLIMVTVIKIIAAYVAVS